MDTTITGYYKVVCLYFWLFFTTYLCDYLDNMAFSFRHDTMISMKAKLVWFTMLYKPNIAQDIHIQGIQGVIKQ